MKALLLIFALWCAQLNSSSQELVRVNEACGECEVNDSRTLADARLCAIDMASEKALSVAGVPLRIKGSSMYHTSDSNSEHIDSFEEVIKTEFSGSLVNVRLDTAQSYIDQFGNVMMHVCISADALIYRTQPDPNFVFELDGLQPAYDDGEAIEFSVTGVQGYLYAFMVEGKAVFPFIPNENEPSAVIKPGAASEFPHINSQQDYRVYDDDPAAPKMLLFAFLKEEATPRSFKNLSDVMDWLAMYELDQKFIFLHPFQIFKE